MKTPKRLTAVLVAAATLATLAATSGCFFFAVGVGAGAGTVAYVNGDLKVALASDFERTAQAANSAVQQLAFVKVSEAKDGLAETIVARDAADTKIEIKLEDAGATLTKVRIRIGVFGDQALSQAILDKIKANL
jgi:hypothetical protein